MSPHPTPPAPATDPADLLELFGRDRAAHVYGLADVQQLWTTSTWWRVGDAAVGLLDLPGPTPVVYAVSTADPDGTLDLLARLADVLPDHLVITGPTGLATRLADRFQPRWRDTYDKLHLADPAALPPPDPRVVGLDRDDLAALEALYATDPDAGDFFHAGLLDTGLYVGIRDTDGALVAAAGVHVVDAVTGVAAIGNVATHPTHRRRGLGRAVVATLCHRLLEHVDVVGLNVRHRTTAARGLYTALGFVPVLVYEEAELVRTPDPGARRPPASAVRDYLEIRTAGPASCSPDSATLLVSSDLPGTAQLYRMPAAGGDLQQVTDDPEPVGGGFLPTADELLLVTHEGGNERLQLHRAAGDGSDRRPLVVDPAHIHRPGGVTRDGRLLAYATNRRNGVDFDVVVHDLADGAERTLDTAGGWRQPAGFSPDGRLLAVTALTTRAGDNELWLLDVATGDAREVLPHADDDPAVVGAPSWLPDGSAGWLAHSVGHDHPVIARLDPATGRHEDVLDLGWSCGVAVDWTGRHALVTANVEGFTRAWLHDPWTLERRGEVPLPGDGVASSWTFARDGSWLAFRFSSGRVPGDVWRLDLNGDGHEPVRLTHSPCGVDPATFVEPALHHATAADGERIPLFVLRPRRPAAGRAPVVVVVHGGPESQYRPSFAPLTQYLVANGFAVVAPNVRGSTGYGKRYQHLDDRERRFDAVADLAAVHDWIAATDDLDADRAALYGGSYGGWMVLMGLTTQPDRWAAGVDIVGMSSLVTFLEHTAPWRRAFREREYGSLAEDRELLEALSPLNHVDAIRAPLFVVHGRNDPRVPVGEAEQIHRVLTARGVRCELAVYDDEGHGLAKLANRVDAYPRIAAFLHEVLDA